MKLPDLADRLGREGAIYVAGALTSLAVAIVLYTRFGIGGTLGRDEAIYTYGGQQMAHGVAPYASIFDPKTPLATMLAGLAAGVARVLGRNDIYLIRLAFFACACLTVLAIYLLAARLWHSALAGIVAAIVFASFNGFAQDALSGPDAKTPGMLLVVLSMWLVLRHQWFWAALAGSLAFLVWQPLVIYPVVAVLVAALTSAGTDRRKTLGLAVGGAAIPLVAITAYFAAAGALGKFFDAAFAFPATGVKRGHETMAGRIRHIATVIHDSYKVSGILIGVGVIALLFLVVAHFRHNRSDRRTALVDPLVSVVLITMLFEIGYACLDFQGSPDVFPFLPYAALGLGGVAALILTWVGTKPLPTRRAVTGGVLAAAAVLAGFSWSWFASDPATFPGLRAQRADACAIERMLGPTGRLYAIGDPVSLVLTHRRNPDRYIYLGSGVDVWKVKHTAGGFDGWTAQIQAADPAVIAISGWHAALRQVMGEWLKGAGYFPAYVGKWRVFLAPSARELARLRGVQLTSSPTDFATGPKGNELPGSGCR